MRGKTSCACHAGPRQAAGCHHSEGFPPVAPLNPGLCGWSRSRIPTSRELRDQQGLDLPSGWSTISGPRSDRRDAADAEDAGRGACGLPLVVHGPLPAPQFDGAGVPAGGAAPLSVAASPVAPPLFPPAGAGAVGTADEPAGGTVAAPEVPPGAGVAGCPAGNCEPGACSAGAGSAPGSGATGGTGSGAPSRGPGSAPCSMWPWGIMP